MIFLYLTTREAEILLADCQDADLRQQLKDRLAYEGVFGDGEIPEAILLRRCGGTLGFAAVVYPTKDAADRMEESIWQVQQGKRS